MYTPVPSKVNFPAMEKSILRLWQQTKAFQLLVHANSKGPRFSFIDGPITANNPMGVHHAWGRTYKDICLRHKAMQGYHQRYQNGFDCQGLWVEVEVEKEMGFNSKREIEAFGLEEFARLCRDRVNKYADMISQQSIRLGQWMDWDHSYFTHTDTNIEHIWLFLQRCHQNGWLYKGQRAMPWCMRCGTSLSQHELVGTDSYREMAHTSVYLKLPIMGRQGEYFMVWTTTPWTLSANVALAVHPDLEYVAVEVQPEAGSADQSAWVGYLSPRTLDFLEGSYRVVGKVMGRDLVGWRYTGPFAELPAQNGVEHRVIPWSEVGEEEGTGVVHIAPGCGAEDFELSKVEGLPVIVPIDEAGNYLAGFGLLGGHNVMATNETVFESLRQKGFLYKIHDYTHRYPSCWRCGEELVFRLAEEWFISCQEIRPRMVEAARSVEWIPPSAGKRMEDWLTNMGDWCISRKRYWGLPLPFYPCSCGHITVVGSRDELGKLALRGTDQLEELHRPWIDRVSIRCPQCQQEVQRIPEVGDAWLDAGIVPFSTLEYVSNREYWKEWFPADFITEMREQIRLWFYSMLFMSVTLEGCSPYKTVLSYEKLLDERGQPMHRSLGNAIWFDEAAERMGADVMRWLYASQSIQSNLLFGYGPAEEVNRKLLTLWNSYSFFITYARIDGFDPALRDLKEASLSTLDRWILSRLQATVQEVSSALDRYDAATATRVSEAFVEDLSTWYIRRSRRRFWKSQADEDKAAAYQTLHHVLVTLVRLLAPIVPFLTEEMYQNLVRSMNPTATVSVHLTRYPAPDPQLRDIALEAEMEAMRQMVSLGRAARTKAAIRVRQPLARALVAGVGSLRPELLKEAQEELNVKTMEIRSSAQETYRRIVRPRPELLGPRLGSDFPGVAKSLQLGEYELRSDGALQVGSHTLAPEEVDIKVESQPGYAVVLSGEIVVAVETTLTPELLAEGKARELVRRIQTMRKEAGFNVEDKIVTRYEAADSLRSVFGDHASYIKAETLSLNLAFGLNGTGYRWSGVIEGEQVDLEVEKA